jgi:hypothetical protein
VPAADRLRDWLALGLVIAGALVYASAARGMTALAQDRTPTTAEAAARGDWKMVRWNRYERMSRLGIGLAAAGAVVSLYSFARHAARRRRAGHAA